MGTFSSNCLSPVDSDIFASSAEGIPLLVFEAAKCRTFSNNVVSFKTESNDIHPFTDQIFRCVISSYI